jgi:hypothetical protein
MKVDKNRIRYVWCSAGKFDYGFGSRGASSVIHRLGGYTDGLIFSGALCAVAHA